MKDPQRLADSGETYAILRDGLSAETPPPDAQAQIWHRLARRSAAGAALQMSARASRPLLSLKAFFAVTLTAAAGVSVTVATHPFSQRPPAEAVIAPVGGKPLRAPSPAREPVAGPLAEPSEPAEPAVAPFLPQEELFLPPGNDQWRAPEPLSKDWNCDWPAFTDVTDTVVRVRVSVDAAGRAASVQVVASDHPEFDIYAIACAERAAYRAGVDRSGAAATLATLEVPIHFIKSAKEKSR